MRTTMTRRASSRLLATLLAMLCGLSPVQAEVTEAQAKRLGADLTPLGAERAGDGDIPAWEGGLTKPPANVAYKKGKHLPDPFADDAVKYTVTAANAAQYEQFLTGGHKALLKAYPDYKLKVYPSRRACAFPDFVYEATKRNAQAGKLIGGGSGVGGAIMGFPFPIPNNAYEIMWNHTLRYRSHKVMRQFAVAPVTREGNYTLTRIHDDMLFKWSDPAMRSAEDLGNVSLYYISDTLAPARDAGTVILVQEPLDATLSGGRQAWQYSPGTRRVRRAPNIAYDNPGTSTDGLSTTDSFDGYNGALDRYDWTVIGKVEKLIPVNNYQAVATPYKDYLKPLHLNQDVIRYEKRRVWQIEAKLKDTTRHVYARRVYYIDEDTWQIAAAELYDSRGQLWRVQEMHQIARYDVPLCGSGTEVIYDLQSGRYLALGMQNEEPLADYSADKLKENNFTPDAIRKAGIR